MMFSHTKEQSLKCSADFRNKHKISDNYDVSVWFDHITETVIMKNGNNSINDTMSFDEFSRKYA